MSNFDFLKDFDVTLYKLGNRIEKQVNISPSGVKADATTFLEHVLKKLLNQAGLKYNSRKPFTDQVDAVFRSKLKMSNMYRERIKGAYNYRNKIHDDFEEIEKHEFFDAVQLHEKLFYIVRKLYTDYNDDFTINDEIPVFRPLELDFSDDEVEQVKVPDFNEIIDIKFDYCIVCGKPNHLNYSIYCHECSSELENANNFISVRNALGKDAEFTKEDLIEYGMPEGYINQFLNSLVRQNMLKAAGRFYSFNNMYLDDYLKRIDNYIAVGELITRFREDKISPSDIRKSREYVLGSRGDETFYQFFKIINREIVAKFERDLITTGDIWESISYTTITDKELKRWYDISQSKYKKGEINEAFVVFNDLMIREYLDLKREGISEDEIKQKLNVSEDVYEFWCGYDSEFTQNLDTIKMDLIVKAMSESKTKPEIIEYAGVTPKEYDDIVKYSNFKGNEFARLRNREIETRKQNFVRYLKNNDLKSSCRLAKFSLEDFYDYYDSSDVKSEFFIQSTRMLMDKYLAQRRLGKTKKEAIEFIGIRELYIDRWLSRTKYSDFRKEDLKVTIKLVLDGLKRNRPIDEIAKTADIRPETINYYIRLGERGSEIHRPIFEFYENELIPEKLDKFLHGSNTKSIRRAMASANLSDEELERYSGLGRSGDERFSQFYDEFYSIKKGAYVHQREKGKTHKIAMKESHLSEEEYLESRQELEKALRLTKITKVLEVISNDKTSNIAASKAGCTVEEIYEWYFLGRDGDEDYREFYELFHKAYVRPNIIPIQEKIDSENVNIDILIRSNRDSFTRKDFDIWVKNGLIKIDMVHLQSDDEDEDEDDDKEIGIRPKFSNPNSNRTSLGRVNDKNYDIEELKKQILG